MDNIENNTLNELQQCIKTWLQNNEKLKLKRNEIKELNMIKKEQEDIILNKMNLLNINIVNLSSGGKIQKTVRKSTRNLKKDELIENIYNILNDNELSEKLINALNDAKPTIEKEKITLKK